MSRIHEALKRAEQERAAREAGGVPAAQAGAEILLPPLTGPASEAAEREAKLFDRALPIGASGREPATPEALLSQCAQPEWKPDGRTMLFSPEESHGYKAEVFRTLRSRLYRLRDQMPLRALLVTSTLPAEGKSFIAANLGQAFAQQHGRRVVLVDADLRVPRLHTMLGAPQC